MYRIWLEDSTFVFLSRSLFTTWSYRDPEAAEDDQVEDSPQPPTFQISLPALLETLQIFSLGDSNAFRQQQDPYDTFNAFRQNRNANDPFSASALGSSGLCRISYDNRGSPLSIQLSEADVTTSCDLTTYEAESTEDIPFDRESLALKTIMRSAHLADAISELASTNPTSLSLTASPTVPHMSLSATGPLGSATVDFNKDQDPPLLETFQCPSRFRTTYNFRHIKAVYRAMVSASKVSVRADEQGVLSLQFLIEVDPTAQAEPGTEGIAFVDFRIVPQVEGEVPQDDSETDDE
ncbi:DNA repair exonuclease rad1 [Aureobasidium subglaciale]|nr:DNA repair exonuclease rad1 [Aureobasidium subglaciale]KAI5227521.1 DNA repair exonuclease rad1 [Aureobasidium subglaciale]KAI5230992.1 DNA repair exonuclease rad1 [Aureobasidium subglaciale]KAI5265263.1 DNA repair exonuclease rad1 [Aureobasidium subglaciale]